ncbi:MAG: hypothetical protein Fur006_47830 [Coleofasciculaceae cyanobacterium]
MGNGLYSISADFKLLGGVLLRYVNKTPIYRSILVINLSKRKYPAKITEYFRILSKYFNTSAQSMSTKNTRIVLYAEVLKFVNDLE